MAELQNEDLQTLLQSYLNCLELCRVFQKHTDDPDVKQALDLLIDDLQTATASLSGQLRRRGVAPGTYELDSQGKARIRDVLGTRALSEQLAVVRRSLADLVAWYAQHPPSGQPDPGAQDWYPALHAQTEQMLEHWDHHLKDMKAIP